MGDESLNRRVTGVAEAVGESPEFVNEYAEGGAANQGSVETARRERVLLELASSFGVNRHATHMSWLISRCLACLTNCHDRPLIR